MQKDSKNIKKAVSLTNYLVSLPRTSYLLTFIFLIGIIFGILANIGTYSNLDLLILGMLDGIFIITLPALLSASTVKLLLRKMEFKKIVATTLIGEFIYAVSYLVSIHLNFLNPAYSQWITFIGSSFVFVLWYYVARIIFAVRWKAFIFSVFQLIFHAFFLMSSRIIFFEGTTFNVLFKFYLSAFLLLTAFYLFFRVINAPMKRLFGVSSMDAFSMFMAQWLYQKKDIESAFIEVGETCKTLLSMIIFDRGTDKKIFLTPYVHFGPFGNLGGSEFSYLLSKALYDKYSAQTFVFHGTVTHDLNPSSSSEIKKIISACESCMSDYQPKNVKVAYQQGKYKECFADNLILGDNSFISLSRAPKVTEDINFGLGLTLISIAEKNCKSASIVDQHNSETGEVTSFEPGSIIGYNYMQAVSNSFSSKIKSNSLSIGFSEVYSSCDMIGKSGIKIALFSSSPKYLLVLIDSNGISPEFRKIIVDELESLGKKHKEDWKIGVFTTDTHFNNSIKGVTNPLRFDKSVLEDIKTASIEALYDMKPSKVFFCNKWFEIDVLGPKQSIELVSTVNSIIAVAKVSAPIIIFGAVLAIIWILSKL
ncbi:MAG: DUF2070 family protein [Candidatus ainarchaeum sp.]|nr:DUF2070 family protein [Candidatus ainarchaeum sp.]